MKPLSIAVALTAALSLSSCDGILAGAYDEPPPEVTHTAAGRLYVDASGWEEWHYLDLSALADSVNTRPGYNTSSAWVTAGIPAADGVQKAPAAGEPGLYTYWYDVFGEGISRREFRSFTPSAAQPAPERWSIAVHRNNLRTNGGAIALTDVDDIYALPLTAAFIASLDFVEDTWSETDVWVGQDRMLLGLIANQGIRISPTGSSWLRMDIPPMPPRFILDSSVRVLRLADGSYAALQLADYQSAAGVKCCLSINYRYPLQIQ